ncbi:MAG: T9SS type A sorting domain-containing protein [Bacteroidia bacterium]
MKTTITRVTLALMAISVLHQSNAQVCFNPKASYTADINSSSLCYADFNGDSIIDLAVANIASGGSNVSILLGDGLGSFSAATNFPVGALPRSICSADFNGDDNADLATTNSGPGNVSILLGNGAGSFTAAAGFGTGIYNQSSICSADFNGDSIADLAITSDFNFVLVALGIGNGGFSAVTQFTADNSTGSVVSADFNGDGDADLAVTTHNGSYNVSVMSGKGAGSFGSATNFAVGTSPISIIGADFNGDGKIDLATANMVNNVTGNVSVLLGNGAGSFAPVTNFGVGAATVPKSICSADFDGDGKIDLAMACIANNSTGNVSIITGDGTGSFGSPVVFAVDSFPVSVISSDFNSDGKMDLALAASKSNIDTGEVSVLINCNTTGFDQLSDNKEQVIVYPNPALNSREIKIISANNINEIKITDISGRIVYRAMLSRSSGKHISFQLDKAGIYFITLTSDKQTMTQKLIVCY